jgi:hypothetical protein
MLDKECASSSLKMIRAGATADNASENKNRLRGSALDGLGSKRTFRNEMSLPPWKTVFVAGEKCQKKSYMSLVQFSAESENLNTDYGAGRYFRRLSALNFKLLLQKCSLRPCHHKCDYQFVPTRFFFQLSFPETLETSKSLLHDSHTSKSRKRMSEIFPESVAQFKTLL